MNLNPAHFEVLSEETRQTFLNLKNLSDIQHFYLAGGTAAALYLGHRLSDDMDFFTQKAFDESLMIQKLSGIGSFELEKKAEQTVIGVLNDTKVTFLGYKYPLLEPLKTASGIAVADIVDIACMKIDAIAGRGAKRDFIDVYFVAKEVASLSEILMKFEQKYTFLNYNMVHVKKSLVYFSGADTDPMPKMLKSVKWDDVKMFFHREVAKVKAL